MIGLTCSRCSRCWNRPAMSLAPALPGISHIRTVFRTPPEVWVYRNRGRGRTMGDTTQPIGADHGPTRTVPTSVSAVASLHAGPRRLADAAPGAGRHRVTVGAACRVATLGRAVT